MYPNKKMYPNKPKYGTKQGSSSDKMYLNKKMYPNKPIHGTKNKIPVQIKCILSSRLFRGVIVKECPVTVVISYQS